VIHSNPRACRLERLEDRLLLSVATDSAGWTVITPSGDSRLVYVSSSSGNDQNGGRSPTAAVASLKRAEALARDGSPDEILLKRGDVWNAAFPRWTKSGRSPDEPMLIGTYGSGNRPVISTGYTASAFSTDGSTPVNDLVIQGLQFQSAVRNPSSPSFDPVATGRRYSGLRWYAPTNSLLIEDCSFRFYSDNLDIEGLHGPVGNVVIRRSTSVDSYSTANHSQGLYAYDVDGLTIEQSVFDHDGWNEQVSGAGQTGYNHDIYLASTTTNIVIRDSVIANASNNGLLARGGGDIEGNLFLDNPSAIAYGGSAGSESAPGGVHGAIIGNVIFGDRALGNLPYGYGISVANTAPGTPTLVADNLFTGDTQHAKSAITLSAESSTKNPQDAVGINDVIIENNVVNGWFRAISTDGSFQNQGSGLWAYNDVSFRDNVLQMSNEYLIRHNSPYDSATETWSGNQYDDRSPDGKWFLMGPKVLTPSQWLAQVDPTGTIGPMQFPDASRAADTYDAVMGGAGTVASFLAAERQQSSDHWDSQYLASAVNAYLQAGFGVSTGPVAAATAPAVTEANTPSSSQGAMPATATSPTSAIYTFTVSYAGGKAIDLTGIGNGNLHIVGPDGFDAAATFVGMTSSDGGKSVVATYSITPPAGQWSGMDDGSYSILMRPGQVRDASGVAVPEGSIGAFAVSLPLEIDGTAGKDHIVLRAKRGQLLITNNGVRTSHSLADVPLIRVHGGEGNDMLIAKIGVPPCLLDGGDGNDVLRGNNGNDTLTGGDGNDFLFAGLETNIVIGGTGDDHLIGSAGTNLLDGGEGNDILRAGRGDHVLIAGNGLDKLTAARGNDLLIGAAASTEDPTALAAVLSAWATGQSFAQRVAALAPAAGSPVVIAGVTFSDNPIAGRMVGGKGSDWFVSSDDVLKHVKKSDVVTALV
jgi:Ca2+-binding RTX toxin-like protein